jgi:energy-coupling factor transport system ATP-binding protein
MDNMSAMVKLEDFYWRYPSFGDAASNPWSLNGINLEVGKGEFFGLTGPSGAGKTTTCKAIMGIIPHGAKIPFQRYNDHLRGSVWVDGELVTGVDASANVVDGEAGGKLMGRGIISPKGGMIMQDPEAQFIRMSVLHEVSFGLQLLKLPTAEIEARVREALQMVGLGYLAEYAEYVHPNDLSGGQKQRVAIASFLAMRPELLILDEPTSDLDPRGKSEVIETVASLRDRHNVTVILVEQDPAILQRFCDRIALIDQGKVRLIEPASEFYRQVDTLDGCSVYRFEVSDIARRAGYRLDGQLPISIPEAVQCLPADLPASLQPPDAKPQPETLIEVRDLTYFYEDGTQALHGVNFDLHKGEVLALLGTNGSGKTTAAKILNGIYKPSGGSVKILGTDVTQNSIRSQLPRHVGYVFQNPDHQIFTRQVREEIRYGLKNIGTPSQEMDAAIMDALSAVGLADKADEDPLFLGKGQRQRLAVASVLAMRPEIIIVDEPTTGQDYGMVCGIMDLLEGLHRQGNTVLIITHDMTLVANYCQRVVVLLDGRNVFTGTPRELFSSPENVALTQLTAPQAISLSVAMRQKNPAFPLLLNQAEWIKALEIHNGQVGPQRTQDLATVVETGER